MAKQTVKLTPQTTQASSLEDMFWGRSICICHIQTQLNLNTLLRVCLKAGNDGWTILSNAGVSFRSAFQLRSKVTWCFWLLMAFESSPSKVSCFSVLHNCLVGLCCFLQRRPAETKMSFITTKLWSFCSKKVRNNELEGMTRKGTEKMWRDSLDFAVVCFYVFLVWLSDKISKNNLPPTHIDVRWFRAH